MARDRCYYVYILANHHGTIYTGVTGNLESRLAQHREAGPETFTGRYQCHRLVYYEEYQYVWDAIDREKQIKGWRRSKKVALIRETNPEWRDLSRDWEEPTR